MGIGGAETMIMNYLRLKLSSDMQFDFVIHTTEKKEFHDEIRSMGGRIISCPDYTIKNAFLYIKWWKEFLNKNHYDIVHGNFRKSAPIYLREAKKRGMHTILHTHSASTRSRFSSMRWFPAYLIYKNSDYIFACSMNAAKWLFGNRIENDKKLVIIDNGIDTLKYSYNENVRRQIRSELGVGDDIVICHVGRFAPMKNHKMLIEIFKEVKKISPNSVLLLVGDGELKDQIQKYVNDSGVLDVKFLGIRRDINRILQGADVFLLPSLFEGLPVSLIEAQVAQLPCVYSSIITEEVIISENVYPISLEADTKKWAETVVRVGSNTQRRCVDYSSSRFDVHVSAKSIMDIYTRLCTI